MSPPAPWILRRSSPPSRPSPPGSLRPALTAAAVQRLITNGGNGHQGKTQTQTRSASRENRVSTKPRAMQTDTLSVSSSTTLSNTTIRNQNTYNPNQVSHNGVCQPQQVHAKRRGAAES